MRTDEEGTAFVFQTDASVMGQDTKDARERPERAELGTPAGLGLRATAGREDGGSDGPRLRLGQGLRSDLRKPHMRSASAERRKTGVVLQPQPPGAPTAAGRRLCVRPGCPGGCWMLAVHAAQTP